MALGRHEIETKFNTNTHPIHRKHTETVLKKSHTQHVAFVPSQYDNTHVDLKEKGRVGWPIWKSLLVKICACAMYLEFNYVMGNLFVFSLHRELMDKKEGAMASNRRGPWHVVPGFCRRTVS